MSIQKVLVVTASTYVTLIFLVTSAAKEGALWRPLQISHSRLLTGARNSGSRDAQAMINNRSINTTCSFLCHQVEWCNLWCIDPSSTTICLYFNMYVVVGYQETNMADALTCFTRSLIDFAVGAVIEGTLPAGNVPLQVKENLIDGIYDFGVYDQCYAPFGVSNPWFKIDLGSVKQIRQIKIVLFPRPYAQNHYDIEARVSIEDVSSSSFENYKPFGYFPGPSGASKEIIFAHESPIEARYVSVQRWSDLSQCSSIVATCQLLLCHLEIN